MESEPQASRPEAQSADAMPDARAVPLLSIGLAVYNGEKHLRQALDSLLGQDFELLELVISDNASTDDTQRICLEYAAEDKRVRYSRNESNLGAAANFNRVFELARGRYFMWGSDDDVWRPAFARLCIDRLESLPGSVLCTSRLSLIDDDGHPIAEDLYQNIDTEGMPVEARVHALIARTCATTVYGVIRPDALRATRLMSASFGTDIRLLLELLLQGESLMVPETLFVYRVRHLGKTAEQGLGDSRSSGIRAGAGEPLADPWGGLARELLDVVRTSGLDKSTITRIEEVFVDTFSHENLDWGGAMISGLGLPILAVRASGADELAVAAALGLDGPADIPDHMSRPRAVWRLREGMRLRRARRGALRLLQPFAERQDAANDEYSALIALLIREVTSLRRRVTELEHGLDTPGD